MSEPEIKPKKRKKRSPSAEGAYIKKNDREATQDEIAEVFGLTKVRIGQLEKIILEKLRHELRSLNPHSRRE